MAALAEAAPAEGFSLLKGMFFHPYSFQVLSQKDWLEFSITVFIIQHSVYKDDSLHTLDGNGMSFLLHPVLKINY